MAIQTAAVIRGKGGPPELGEFEQPEADGNEVVVEVELAGLNPIDLWTADGELHGGSPPIPYVAGYEGVGRIDGEGSLYYFGGATSPYGSFAPRALVKRERLIEIPEGTDPGLAVTFGIAGQAGWLSVSWTAALEPTEKVIVLGASGIVGQIAVQAAKALGAGRVVAVARSESGLERARASGADATVQHEGPGDRAFTERLLEAADGPVEVVIDTLWGSAAVAALDATGVGGRLVQIGNSSGEKEATFPARLIRGQAREILGHMNGLVPEDVRNEAYLEMCRRSIGGELGLDVEEVPLEEVADAWQRQRRGPGRKLVIRP